MKRDVYECKRCESNCLISSFPDDEGNTWPEEYLDGILCSCSKWEKRTNYDTENASHNSE